MMNLAVAALLALAQNNDKAQANGYDDAWKSAWKTHLTAVIAGGPAKTNGFVLQVGDSITHSNPYSQWPRAGNGVKTGEDIAVCTWAQTTTGFPGNNNDPNQTTGFYLAAADTHGGRGMTASSGISAFEFLSGSGNNSTTDVMPSTGVTATAKTTVSDPTLYDNNLNITTVAAAFNAAQFAVLMLGTNDIGAGRTTGQFTTDLGDVVAALEAQHIGVILSTIPPRVGLDVTPYNAAIRTMASTLGLPLIDFYSEILARRSGTSWQNSLIDSDGIHPSAQFPLTGTATYTSSSDPYATGGSIATHKTGDACINVGYLLRSWLTMQKLKEVKAFVLDGFPAVPANPSAVSPSTPSGGRAGGHCGGSVAGPVSPWTLLVAALAALALTRAARKSGF